MRKEYLHDLTRIDSRRPQTQLQEDNNSMANRKPVIVLRFQKGQTDLWRQAEWILSMPHPKRQETSQHVAHVR